MTAGTIVIVVVVGTTCKAECSARAASAPREPLVSQSLFRSTKYGPVLHVPRAYTARDLVPQTSGSIVLHAPRPLAGPALSRLWLFAHPCSARQGRAEDP